MKILILGGDGMAGHALYRAFKQKHDVRISLRREKNFYQNCPLLLTTDAYYQIDALDLEKLRTILAEFKPEVVINTIGVVKQKVDDAQQTYLINSLFPKQLALLCDDYRARLIHLSTDCVFSGKKGNYSEQDIPDANDVYGLSKLLGEVQQTPHLTLRISIIGKELLLKPFHGLVEWFLAQSGRINGYSRAIFSGFTTSELARFLDHVITEHPTLTGLWHASMAPISKYDLLTGLQQRLQRPGLEIIADEALHCDRSLNSEALRKRVGYTPPSWAKALDELSEEVSK